MLAPCLMECTKERPSVKELKKNKFFNRAASRAEIKEQLCSLLKIAEPTGIKDLPPSQASDLKVKSLISTWDFSSIINRESTDFGINTRADSIQEESKDFQPSLDDVD